jgi:LPS sulfotransferase NodH
MKNIIILSQPRTGSNLLCELFFAYDSFRILNELFIRFHNINHVPHTKLLREHEITALIDHFKLEDRSMTSLIETLNNNTKETLMFLSQIISQYKIIKIHDFMLKDFDLDFVFNDPETKFIVLERESKISQYISRIVADRLFKWNYVDTSDIKVYVDPDKFLKFKEESINWYKDIETRLINNGYNYLKLSYEKDLEDIDYDIILPKINNWLDENNISYHNNEYKIKYHFKQNQSTLEYVIENFSEIKNLIS